MKYSHDFLEIHTLRNQRLNLHYRVANIDNSYYLIPTHQSFIQRFIPFLNWGLPIKAYEITVDDFQRLTNLKRPRHNSWKVALGTGLGLMIGNTIISLAGSIDVIGRILIYISLSLVIALGLLVYLWLSSWTKKYLQSLGINQSKLISIQIKPLKWFVLSIRFIFLWVLGYVLVGSTINLLLNKGDDLSSLLILFIGLFIVFYTPAAAFYEGLYIFKTKR